MIDKTGESWCISKHLLATTMRLMEVVQVQGDGKTKDAKTMFAFAYKALQFIFGLKIKI